ncbi:MAG: hypothetical protein HFE36_05325 [Clostridia bacterium]|nr:hypothetical protein [Clostridia bacterium]
MQHKHIKCPQCGNFTQADFPYCNHCCAKLENILLEAEEIEEDAAFVPTTETQESVVSEKSVISESRAYCNYCGTKLDNTATQTEATEEKPKLIKRIFKILSILFGVCLGIALILCISSESKEHKTAIRLLNTGLTFVYIGGIGLILTLIAFGLYSTFSPTLIAEREKNKKQLEEHQKEVQQLENWKLNNIKKTMIVHTSSKKDTGSTIARGVAGAWIGGNAGAIVGASTGKTNNFTTFLIVYSDDSRETREIQNGSELYNIYIKYLEV